MKSDPRSGRSSLLRLLVFLLWYGVAAAALFYLLPAAGAYLEQHYEALGGTVKLIAVLAVFAVIGVWQAVSMRDRH